MKHGITMIDGKFYRKNELALLPADKKNKLFLCVQKNAQSLRLHYNQLYYLDEVIGGTAIVFYGKDYSFQIAVSDFYKATIPYELYAIDPVSTNESGARLFSRDENKLINATTNPTFNVARFSRGFLKEYCEMHNAEWPLNKMADVVLLELKADDSKMFGYSLLINDCKEVVAKSTSPVQTHYTVDEVKKMLRAFASKADDLYRGNTSDNSKAWELADEWEQKLF